MIKLKDFETIKSPLLKEWGDNEKEFESITKHLYYILKTNINHNLVYEAGESVAPYDSEYFLSAEKLENVFGLPYTSSGDFAAIWNTNTQARAKYGAPLYFRGVAYTENREGVLIFDQDQKNTVEKTFYFYEYEFLQYQEQEKKKQAAKDWNEFLKASNKIKNKALEILKQYEGKPYGEKTRDKIHDELRSFAQTLGASAWLSGGEYCQGLEIKKNTLEKKFYFTFIDDEHKIQQPTTHNGESVKDLETFDAVKEFEKAHTIAEKMKSKAQELLKLITEYNTHADRINQRPKATESTYSADLERISRGDL